jgi:hypothetical protein
MKIKINETESYTIEMKDEVSATEFNTILDRLNRLSKFIGRDVFDEVLNGPSKPLGRPRKDAAQQADPASPAKERNPNRKTREDALEMFRIYYAKLPHAEKDILLSKYSYNYITFRSATSYMKKKFNITNDDIARMKIEAIMNEGSRQPDSTTVEATENKEVKQDNDGSTI